MSIYTRQIALVSVDYDDLRKLADFLQRIVRRMDGPDGEVER